jgi:zinc D-Ala-D-Ala dipeptidase
MKNILVDAVKISNEQCEYPIQCKLAYATKENFVGRVIDGYHPEMQNVYLLTAKPANALCQVQNILNKKGLGLFVFDAYRPLRAVRDFAHWFQQPPANEYELERKKIHYPHLRKDQLSEQGYVADKVSKHCFGATVDLSLIDLKNNQLLNMGACFDFFDVISHPTATVDQIGMEAFNNRKILADAMLQFSFMPFPTEFWHFDGAREVQEPMDIAITLENV